MPHCLYCTRGSIANFHFAKTQRCKIPQYAVYICTKCKPIIKNDKVPGRCVLNGLQCEAILNELKKLGSIEFTIISESEVLSNGCEIGNVYG